MIRRAAVLLLVSGVLAASGCCGWVYRPFGPGTLCDTSNCGCCEPCTNPCGPVASIGRTAACVVAGGAACGSACGGPACGPACGPTCGPACGPVCDAPCDSCGTMCEGACGAPCDGGCGTCGPCGSPCNGQIGWRHPFLAALFHPIQWTGCSRGGCGELYLGDFHSNPPDCCDPCDRCGQWTGGGPMMDYAAGPAMDYSTGPVMASPPTAPAAPASTCPNCGKSHASVQSTNQGYTSAQPPRMVSQTSGMVPSQPRQARSNYSNQAMTRPSTVAR